MTAVEAPTDWQPGKAKLTEEDAAQLAEMYANSFSTWRQLTDQWNSQHPDKSVTHVTVQRRVKPLLQRQAQEQLVAVDEMRARQDGQLNVLIRIALSIAAAAKCGVCNGEKTIAKDRLDPSLGRELCPKCEGSGLNTQDETRLRAITTVKSLLERRAKLWGLDSPERIEMASVSLVAMDVSQLDDLSLERELANHFGNGAAPPRVAGTANPGAPPPGLPDVESDAPPQQLSAPPPTVDGGA
jgi:hypothetical protein